MGIRMGVSSESVKGMQPVPEGIYELRLEGFQPKKSNKGDSINFRPILKITSGPAAGRQIFNNLNNSSAAGFVQNDFCHCFGLPMDDLGGGELVMPGEWDGDANNPESWQYRGPLVGRVGKAFVAVTTYNGKPQNEIKYYICNVPDCNTKFPEMTHSTNLIKNRS